MSDAQSRGTVLLVEDNEDNQHIYEVYLTHVGFVVLTARDAESALPLARERRPDLVLMDVSLPGMDGYAATRALKTDPQTAGIPVVVLTAHAGQEARDRAAAAGCAHYLSKPIDPRSLAAEVTRLLAAGAAP
jgi:two-component system, cell cycle response regulator DivK